MLYLVTAFMIYLSEISNFLKKLNILITEYLAYLVNEDEYIRSAKKLYDAKTV